MMTIGARATIALPAGDGARLSCVGPVIRGVFPRAPLVPGRDRCWGRYFSTVLGSALRHPDPARRGPCRHAGDRDRAAAQAAVRLVVGRAQFLLADDLAPAGG